MLTGFILGQSRSADGLKGLDQIMNQVGELSTRRFRFSRFRLRLPFKRSRPVVAVIRLEGIIASGGRLRPTQLCDSSLAPYIEKAFKRGKPCAVALVVNSPGGSPVQSSLIAARIRDLAAEKSIPVVTFVEDVAASGGYWLAAAGDEIYADPSSIVGSIGVISSSFGFTDLIKKIGVERRVHTAGKNKNILDPFLPEAAEDISILKDIQADIHDQFISYVRDRRGDRIGNDEIFTGQFWTGNKGKELGLVDDIGHLMPVMKEKYGDKVRFLHYAKKKRFFSSLGSQLVETVLEELRIHAIWSRFGL